jgi:hypothetical protein
MYKYYQGSSTNIETIIGEQMVTITIIENELNEAKIRLKQIENDKNNKLRLVEINTYYSEKYNDQTHIVKILIFFCVLLIILLLLTNKGIIPPMLFKWGFIVIVFVGAIVLWRHFILNISRDNMNYQEFDWGKSPTTPSYNTDNPEGTNPWEDETGLTCVAQECCQTGFTYAPSPVNKCVSDLALPEGVKPYTTQTTNSESTV